jgi:hypothetical protein
MKVSRLIELLQEQNKPDEEIVVLWWEKNHFDFPEDYELKLTDEAWLKVSTEFDLWDNAGAEIGEWISDAVIEYSEVSSVAQDNN